MKTHYVIGCGGIGSWLAPSLNLLVGVQNTCMIDGDKLEEKNLNRQLFSEDDVGKYKVHALCEKYGGACESRYYSFGIIQHQQTDWLFVCVDNNPARLAALRACDHFGCSAIVAGNETTSSEAYFYSPKWKDTLLDPRVYYPELLTDRTNDPQRPGGCTGEAQRQNPQLVSANFSAAALAQNLYVLWGMKASTITKESFHRMPYHYKSNISRLEHLEIGDKNKQQKERLETV
jgi:ThiF family